MSTLTQYDAGKMSRTDILSAWKSWQVRTFVTIWITYGSFYLCRANISFALPGLTNEFGYSKTLLGLLGTALFIMYSLGQFVNGQLGDKYGARKLVFVGMIGSALLNIVFSFSTAFGFMLVVWGLNGYFQSMGWSPQVKTMANWFTVAQRGKWMGLLGSCYQIGNALAWLLASSLAAHYTWRTLFWVPSILLLISSVHFVIRLRNAPEEVGLPPIEQLRKIASGEAAEPSKLDPTSAPVCHVTQDKHMGFGYTVKVCLTNPRIWGVSVAFFCLDIIRYGFFYWAPVFLIEVQGASITSAGLSVAVLPLAGSAGSIFCGWATGRFFDNRRAPVVCLCLFGLAIFSYLFYYAPEGAWVLGLVYLALIGFCTYGAHVLMVGHAAQDFAGRKAAASAAGFIDGFGYLGAAMTGIFTGWLVDNYSWTAGFWYWIIAALVAAFIMLALWRVPVVELDE
ncbi:MAG: MFS transporter [Deltaproteobacteria bacterium]|nr:MFS transporter [Deltaproteobacteria bacterium]